MKAGLKAHLSSLKPKDGEEAPEKITGSNIHKPGYYKRFVAESRAAHRPIPPAEHIAHAGHHWVKYNPSLSGSADGGEWMVVQWSPTELCWYMSNQLASAAKPVYGDGLLEHWDYIADIPLPPIEVELAARMAQSHAR